MATVLATAKMADSNSIGSGLRQQEQTVRLEGVFWDGMITVAGTAVAGTVRVGMLDDLSRCWQETAAWRCSPGSALSAPRQGHGITQCAAYNTPWGGCFVPHP